MRRLGIGGHLIELLGRVPDAGEVVEVEGFAATVLAVDEARVEALRIAAPQNGGRGAA